MAFQISRADGTGEASIVDDVSELMAVCKLMSDDGTHKLDILDLSKTQPSPPPTHPAPPVSVPPAPAAPAVSTWSNTVVDSAAKARIEAQHESLKASGIHVPTSEQFYETGTRMATEGYKTQHARKAEHDAKLDLAVAAASLARIVQNEKREDCEIKAGELAGAIAVNGPVSAFGLTLRENAIRGLAARIESPMISYVLGVCERIAAESMRGASANREAIARDKATVAEVIAHECRRNPDVPLKLRTRRGAPSDVFAVVSPSYTPADAPALLAEIEDVMPRGAKGSFAYDAGSTSWELRANVWTPTPVDQQAVGEAFEGYVSFRSKDNGTGRLRGGGGINLLRCLNASTYTANGSKVSRTHRGGILNDVRAMMRGSVDAIHALCEAWGMARDSRIDVPTGMTIEDAIPGFWRYCLTARSGELAGVLPGRTETNVAGLTAAYHAERRDPGKIVRADLAQGWTRYIQNCPSDIRRDAESAIGSWVVGGSSVGFVAAAS